MSQQGQKLVRDSRFRELLRDAAANDPDACKAIVDEYGGHIVRAVRRHINRSIRDRADSEDFAQAVWASFFGHISVVQDLEDERQLTRFLASMARHKVIDAGRRRRVRRESNSGGAGDLQVVKDYRRLVSQPTPSEFAMANEEWSQLNGNTSDRDKELLNLRRAGATQAEIAERMGVSERHIRRILSRISRRRTGELDADSDLDS